VEAFQSVRSIPQAILRAPASANASSFDAVKSSLPAMAKLPFSFSATRLVMEILPPASVKLSFSLATRMAMVILPPERATSFSF